MKSNELHSLSQIGQVLKDAQSILIFPHGSIDGDALGSSVALCLGLRSIGKTSYVIMDENIPTNIQFIENGCVSRDLDVISNPDVCICIDNGELSRLFSRQDLFAKGKTQILIDHHKSSKPFLDYNYIDVSAAAVTEIVYDLLLEMGIAITPAIAESIYTGIVTDTGRFQYSNTTKRTHQIVSELMDYEIDQNKVSVEVYQSVSYEKIKLETLVLNTLRLVCDGKVATASMTLNMLKESGAKDEETEGIVEILRNLRGVEVALFAKENNKEGVKISMRSKYSFDVAQIAQRFNGGGHMKAAGFSSSKPIDTVVDEAISAIEEEMSAHGRNC